MAGMAKELHGLIQGLGDQITEALKSGQSILDHFEFDGSRLTIKLNQSDISDSLKEQVEESVAQLNNKLSNTTVDLNNIRFNLDYYNASDYFDKFFEQLKRVAADDTDYIEQQLGSLVNNINSYIQKIDAHDIEVFYQKLRDIGGEDLTDKQRSQLGIDQIIKDIKDGSREVDDAINFLQKSIQNLDFKPWIDFLEVWHQFAADGSNQSLSRVFSFDTSKMNADEISRFLRLVSDLKYSFEGGSYEFRTLNYLQSFIQGGGLQGTSSSADSVAQLVENVNKLAEETERYRIEQSRLQQQMDSFAHFMDKGAGFGNEELSRRYNAFFDAASQRIDELENKININQQTINNLFSSLDLPTLTKQIQEIVDAINNISNAIGKIDDQSGIQSLTQQFKGLVDQITAMQGALSIGGINVNVSANVTDEKTKSALDAAWRMEAERYQRYFDAIFANRDINTVLSDVYSKSGTVTPWDTYSQMFDPNVVRSMGDQAQKIQTIITFLIDVQKALDDQIMRSSKIFTQGSSLKLNELQYLYDTYRENIQNIFKDIQDMSFSDFAQRINREGRTSVQLVKDITGKDFADVLKELNKNVGSAYQGYKPPKGLVNYFAQGFKQELKAALGDFWGDILSTRMPAMSIKAVQDRINEVIGVDVKSSRKTSLDKALNSINKFERKNNEIKQDAAGITDVVESIQALSAEIQKLSTEEGLGKYFTDLKAYLDTMQSAFKNLLQNLRETVDLVDKLSIYNKADLNPLTNILQNEKYTNKEFYGLSLPAVIYDYEEIFKKAYIAARAFNAEVSGAPIALPDLQQQIHQLDLYWAYITKMPKEINLMYLQQLVLNQATKQYALILDGSVNMLQRLGIAINDVTSKIAQLPSVSQNLLGTSDSGVSRILPDITSTAHLVDDVEKSTERSLRNVDEIKKILSQSAFVSEVDPYSYWEELGPGQTRRISNKRDIETGELIENVGETLTNYKQIEDRIKSLNEQINRLTIQRNNKLVTSGGLFDTSAADKNIDALKTDLQQLYDLLQKWSAEYSHMYRIEPFKQEKAAQDAMLENQRESAASLNKIALNKQYDADIASLDRYLEKMQKVPIAGQQMQTQLNQTKNDLESLNQQFNAGALSLDDYYEKYTIIKNTMGQQKNGADGITAQYGEVEKLIAKLDQLDKAKNKLNAFSEVLQKIKNTYQAGMQNGDLNIASIISQLKQLLSVQSQFNANTALPFSGTFDRENIIQNLIANADKLSDRFGITEATLKSFNQTNQTAVFTAKDGAGIIRDFTMKIVAMGNGFQVAQKDAASFARGLTATGRSFRSLFGHFTYFMSAAGALRLIWQQFRKGISAVQEFDKALTNMSYTMDLTKEDLRVIGNDAVQMARDLDISVNDMMKVYQIYANMQTTAKEIEETARPTAILANLSGVDASTAADEIQGVINQFDLLAKDSAHIADVYDYISSQIAVDYAKGIEGMAAAVQNSGNVAYQAGLSFEQLSSVIATTMEQTRQSGSIIGNGLRTILTRISKSSSMADDVSNEEISKAAKVLHEVGVEVYTANGEFREFDVIMTELSQKWDSLTDSQRQNISYQIAATRQTALLSAILQNWGRSMELAAEATDSMGNAEANQAKYMESFAGQIQSVKTNMDAFWVNLIKSDSAYELLDLLNQLTESLVALGKTFGGLQTIGAGVVEIIGFKLAKDALGRYIRSVFDAWKGTTKLSTALATSASKGDLFTLGLTAAATVITTLVIKFKQAQAEFSSAMQSINNEFKNSADEIKAYAKDINKYLDIINNPDSSFDSVIQANDDLRTLQDQLISQYGVLPELINLTTDAYKNQKDVIDGLINSLEREEYLNQKDNIDTTNTSYWNRVDNVWNGGTWDETNSHRIIREMSHYNLTNHRFSSRETSKYIARLLSENGLNMVFDNNGTFFASDNIYAVKDVLEQIKQGLNEEDSTDAKVLTYINDELSNINKIIQQRGDFYLASVKYNKVLTNDAYSSAYAQLENLANKYQDETSAEQRNSIAKIYSDVLNSTLANIDPNTEKDIYEFFENLHPSITVQAEVVTRKKDIAQRLHSDDYFNYMRQHGLTIENFESGTVLDSTFYTNSIRELKQTLENEGYAWSEVVEVIKENNLLITDTEKAIRKYIGDNQLPDNIIQRLLKANPTQQEFTKLKNMLDAVNSDEWKQYINEIQLAIESGYIDESREFGDELAEVVIGSINTADRKVLQWTEENIANNRDALASYFYAGFESDKYDSLDEYLNSYLGSYSTVDSKTISDFADIPITFTPIINDPITGQQCYLSYQAVESIIQDTINRIKADGKDWTINPHLLIDYDTSGIIMGAGGSAEQASAFGHLAGQLGSIADLEAYITKEFHLTKEEAQDLYKYVTKYGKNYNAVLSATLSFLYKIKDTEALQKNKIEVFEGVQELQSGLDILNEIYQDVSDAGEFDYSKILNNDNFKETFGDLTDVTEEYKNAYTDFIDTIVDSPDDIDKAQEAFNNLVTAYIMQSGVLSGVTEETRDQTKRMLEQWGIINADKVIDSYIGQIYNLASAMSFCQARGLDLMDVDAAWLQMLIDTETLSQNAAQAVAMYAYEKQVAAGVGFTESGNARQLLMLAESAGVAGDTIGTLGLLLDQIQSGNTQLIPQYMTLLNQSMAKVKSQKNSIYSPKKPQYKPPKTKDKDSGEKDTAEEIVDWIEKLIDRLERKLSHLEKVAGSAYETWETRAGALSEAIGATTAEIEAQRAAYDRYMQEAANVGLDESYAQKVRDGALDIETITDEELKDKISKYEEYYTAALDAEEKIYDLTLHLSELAQQQFELIQTKFEKMITSLEADITHLQNEIDDIFQKTLSTSYDELIAMRRQEMDLLQQEYNELTQSLADSVAAGYITEGTEAWYDMDTAIKEVSNSLQEQRNTIHELIKEQFDLIDTMYSNIINNLSLRYDKMEAAINHLETVGFVESEGIYRRQMTEELNNLSKYYDELEEQQNAFNNAVAQGMEEGSDAWFEMQDAINSTWNNIIECISSIDDLQVKLWELDWSKFDHAQNMIQNVIDEANFLIGMFDEISLIDDYGFFTSNGVATEGLHMQNYQTMKQQAQMYLDAIHDIEDIMNGNYDLNSETFTYLTEEWSRLTGLEADPELWAEELRTNDKLLQRKQELIDAYQGAIQGAEDEKDAIIDLINQAYDAQLAYINKLIDAKKEQLDADKALYEYSKNVEEQTKNIGTLQNQLAAIANDNSEEAMARRQKLQAELDEAQKQLDETQYDKWYNDQQEMLDKLSKEYGEMIDEVKKNEDKNFAQIQEYLDANLEEVHGALDEVADKVGYEIQENAFSTIWGSSSTMSDVLGGVQSSINTIIAFNERMYAVATNLSDWFTRWLGMDSTITDETSARNFVNGLYQTFLDRDADEAGFQDWYEQLRNGATVEDIIKGFVFSDEYMAKNKSDREIIEDLYQAILGRNGEDAGIANWLDYLKRGATWEDVIRGFVESTEFSESGQWERLLDDWLDVDSGYGNSILSGLDDTSRLNDEWFQHWLDNLNKTGRVSVIIEPTQGAMGNISIDTLNFDLPNVTDYQSFVKAAQSDPNFEKMVQSMTVNKIAGGSSLAKYKY